MVRYRRNFVPGGTFFFTVTVADRRSSVLVDHIVALRAAFRVTRSERPFAIDAIVVLPDHLHTIMTLPPDDSDFSGRWRRIKSLFTRRVSAQDKTLRKQNGEHALWQPRFWEHTRARRNGFCSARGLHPLQRTVWSRAHAIGRFRRFTTMSSRGCCPKIGAGASTTAGTISASAKPIQVDPCRCRSLDGAKRNPGFVPRGTTAPALRCAPCGLRPHSRLSRDCKKMAYRGRIRLRLRLVGSWKGPTLTAVHD
jgi:REP element-mobilizing transposase RayT